MKKIVWPKKILHIDMDAFFASIEQRDRPELLGKPVIVGGDPFGRGVVSTASYEARKFGIHSAMPAAHARKLCPQAVFLRPDFEKYSAVSGRIMGILRQHTDLVEPASLDEAYLDVTRHRFGIEDPVMVATLIKQAIFAVTKLTASAGVAPNCFLAKVASDFRKPDGLTVVRPDEVLDFLRDLPIRKIPGVGPVTEKELQGMGIRTCGELADTDEKCLVKKFGKTGSYLKNLANGIDDRKVEPYGPPKQLSTEETFAKDIRDREWLKSRLRSYSREVMEALGKEGRKGRTVVLKVKYFDFELITRSKTAAHCLKDASEVYEVASRLLDEKTRAGEKPVRLLGLGISGLEDAARREVPKEKDLFEGMDF